ncbi:hypothetical protein [Sedimenticola hydrogenitrophicus]|uniref:hypothetical protein n=1 Tax=Sedimenticola hydrogenitrophicus TaxID=2967975 RepID=UPI0023AFF274|nr:hypothetical protein [Sedimenticola hydrogenitrophicus]
MISSNHKAPDTVKRYTWTSFFQIALLLALLFSTYFIYQYGFSAGPGFDDSQNLSGLSSVTNTDSALTFLTDGKAGPLGRPISLLTFMLQKHYWPDFTSELIRTNTLIHLINALLVTLLVLQIFQKNLEFNSHEATWIALLVTAVWVLHPFNSSAVLMTIQRMTLLAAMFSLIGLNLYLRGRALLSHNPRRAYLLMGSGVIGCTILSALCKENGALLPLYALALEVTIIKPPLLNKTQQKIFTLWKGMIFITPIAFLLLYYIFTWDSILASYGTRNFTLNERLATESVILWKYILQIIAPNISLMGPYHDDQAIWIWSFKSFFAAITLIASTVIAVYTRRGAPILALGILWFMCGHILESTIFPLELYFEHRNYLPSLGIIFVILFACLQIQRVTSLKQKWMIAIYPFMFGFLLTQTISLWGNQLLAAKMWYQYHPYSPRAAQNYSQKLVYNNNREKADKVINSASERMPNDSGLALQTLQLGCFKDERDALSEKFHNVVLRSSTMEYSGAALDALHNLIDIEQKDDCTYLNLEDINILGNTLLKNKHFRNQEVAVYNLHLELSRISIAKKDLNLTMHHLESAHSIKPTIETLSSMFTTLVSAELYKEALQIVHDARKHSPKNIFKRHQWKESIENLEKFLIEKINANNTTSKPTTLITGYSS